MNAQIILDETFPHGTPDGYLKGCRGGHCPNQIACRDVHRRYSGDYGFRKKIDAGESAVDITEAEARAVRDAAEAEKAAKRMTGAAKRNHVVKTARTGSLEARHKAVRHLHSEGLRDFEIAAQLGVGRRYITDVRNDLRLAPHREISAVIVKRLHGQGLTDTEIYEHVNKTRKRKVNRRSVSSVRLRLGLEPNKQPPATSGVFSSSEGT